MIRKELDGGEGVVELRPKKREDCAKQTKKKNSPKQKGCCLCIIDLNKHSGWGWLVSEEPMARSKCSYMGQGFSEIVWQPFFFFKHISCK